MKVIEVSKEENIITFISDHGVAYGGERTIYVDTEGKTGRKLYEHIKEYAGVALAKAAKEQGYCN